MKRRKHGSLIVAAVAISLGGTFGSFLAEPVNAQSAQEPVIYLDQAWSQADREMYYWTSQGSAFMSYDIFLNLEAAGGQELFRSDANVGRYGLYPGAANPRNNPDGLPIGVTKTVFTEGRWKGEYVGLTCLARSARCGIH